MVRGVWEVSFRIWCGVENCDEWGVGAKPTHVRFFKIRKIIKSVAISGILRLCEVIKNDGKANEAVLERGMIALNEKNH